MKVTVKLTREDLKRLVLREIEARLGSVPMNEKAVLIETKSTQNYKSEWESADFRATYDADMT